MKIVYMATPEFAVLPLIKLNQTEKVEIVAVICQPPKIANRNKLSKPAIIQTADELGIPVHVFSKLRTEGVSLLKGLSPDLIITCAYGQILSQEILDIAKYGVLNIHASLLPKYRGASPINSALIDGETKTGVTIMKTIKQLDAGDILLSREINIDESDDSLSLGKKLSSLGADAVCDAVKMIMDGNAEFVPQDSSQATYCGKLTAETEIINWENSAESINNLIRGLAPKPSAYSCINSKRFKILSAQVNNDVTDEEAVIGEVIRLDKKGIFVKCGQGTLQLKLLQLEGGKAVTAQDIINGRKISVGQVFANE